jgi:hypothetical protein
MSAEKKCGNTHEVSVLLCSHLHTYFVRVSALLNFVRVSALLNLSVSFHTYFVRVSALVA